MHIFYQEDGCKKKFHKIRIAGQGQKVRHVINQQRELFMAAQVTATSALGMLTRQTGLGGWNVW